MQRQNDSDRHSAIGQPVGRGQAHRLDPPLLAADGAVREQRGRGVLAGSM